MKIQQALKFALPVRKSYGSWVRHPQVEVACGRLALWLVRGGFLWLTSDEVAGKSHFVQALADEHPKAVMIDVQKGDGDSVEQLKTWLDGAGGSSHWMVDLPAGGLPQAKAFALFHLIERAREMQKGLLISWRIEEPELAPPELRSRMLMMEKVEMQAPFKDEDLELVLKSVLQTMQWDMKETVLPTLLKYLPRELSTLLEAIERLDQHSREKPLKINAASAKRILEIHD